MQVQLYIVGLPANTPTPTPLQPQYLLLCRIVILIHVFIVGNDEYVRIMVVSQRKPQKNHKGAKFYYVKLKKKFLIVSLIIN